jgi:hypothetical protein
MNSAILHAHDNGHPATGRPRPLLGMVLRLCKVLPSHRRKPSWVRVSDRAWRRHSALLTFSHEAQSGKH